MQSKSNRIATLIAVAYFAAIVATNLGLFLAPHSDWDSWLVVAWALINLSPILCVAAWGLWRTLRHARHGTYGQAGSCPECLGVMDEVRRLRARLLHEEFTVTH